MKKEEPKSVKITLTLANGQLDTNIEHTSNVSNLELVGLLDKIRLDVHNKIISKPS